MGCASTKVACERSRRPRRIIIIRHGQSQGNVDETIYTRTPDWKVPLTEAGRDQARQAGEQLRALLTDDKLYFYTSPYERCQQTLACIIEGLDRTGTVRVEPRLREQDFGNYQDGGMKECKEARATYGRFFYRFPCGESGADVYDRVSNWFDTLYRDMDYGAIDGDTTVVVVTHGLTARFFLMRWYHWSIACFERLKNPPNAQILVMERDNADGFFELTPASKASINFPEDDVANLRQERLRQTSISANIAAQRYYSPR